MERIVNPFKGIDQGWGWEEHKAHKNPATGRPYLGGVDYKTAVKFRVRAATAGTAYHMGAGWVAIRRSNGVRVNYRELGSISGTFPRRVSIGDTIGFAGRKWAHIDAQNVFGVRIPFEPLVKKYDLYVAKQRALAVKKARQAEVRKIGRYLNAQKLGKKTAAAINGNPGPVYWWLVQAWGKESKMFDRKVTGTPGPLTMKLERALAKQVKA